MSEGGSICGSNIPNFVGNSNDCFKYDSKEKYENNPFQCGTAVKVDVPRGFFDNNTSNCILDPFRDWSSQATSFEYYVVKNNYSDSLSSLFSWDSINSKEEVWFEVGEKRCFNFTW